MTDDEPDGTTLSRGLTLAAAAMLFLLLRLFVVGEYDWNVVFALLQTVDIESGLSIVIGTVMADSIASTAAMIALMALVTAQLLSPSLRSERDHSDWLVLALVVAAVISFTISFRAWWLPVVAVAIGGALTWLTWKPRRGPLGTATTFAAERIGASTVVLMLVAAALIRTPWVPLETITTEAATLRGYVVRTDDGFLKVLTEADRKVVIVVSNDIRARVKD